MKRPVLSMVAGVLVLAASLTLAAQVLAQTDPLPSWNDGPAKKAIVDFVQATTTQGNPKFVPPPERIATFDQDGTLWVEYPMYSQVNYCLDRVPAVVKAKPELANVEPFKTVMSGNRDAMAKLSKDDLFKILAATLTGMPVDTFKAEVAKWFAEAKDPRWKRPYTELTYQPMQEVLKYLRPTGTKTPSSPAPAGLRAHLCGAGLRHPARAGGGHSWGDKVRLRQERQAVPDQRPQAAAQRQQCRESGGHPSHDRPPALCGLRQLDRRSRDAGVHGGGQRRTAHDAGAARRREARVCLRPGPGAAGRQGRHLHAGAVRRSEEEGLDRHQHEERLEAHLHIRAMKEITMPGRMALLLFTLVTALTAFL